MTNPGTRETENVYGGLPDGAMILEGATDTRPPMVEEAAMTNDGGSAFPRPGSVYKTAMLQPGEEVSRAYVGMSLLDWFAGMAMRSLVSRNDYADERAPGNTAHHAYRYADAMLAEREKRLKELRT